MWAMRFEWRCAFANSSFVDINGPFNLRIADYVVKESAQLTRGYKDKYFCTVFPIGRRPKKE